MSEFDDAEAANSQLRQVLSILNTFLRKLHDEGLTFNSKEDLKNCLQAAKNVERIMVSLESKDSLEIFLSQVPNLFSFDRDQLQKMCDIVLSKVLTALGVSTSCVRTCIEEYIKLCGLERLESVLSSVIFCSEIYRVLLDYMASSESGMDEIAIRYQSQLISCMWQHETDSLNFENWLYDWLKSDMSGKSIAVALMVIISEDKTNPISCGVVHVLNTVLLERSELTMLFWKIFMKQEFVRKALQNSNELRKSIMEFFSTTGQWMEATDAFTWVSREPGPCKDFDFDKLTSVLKCLHNMDGPMLEEIKEFLANKRNAIGCTLWDDIDIQLIDECL